MNFVKVLLNCLLLLSVMAGYYSQPKRQIYTCSNLIERPGNRRTLLLNDDAEARHHIIPFNILRSFFQEAWNIAYGEHTEGMTRLRQYIMRYIRNLMENYDEMAQQARSSHHPMVNRAHLFRNIQPNTIILNEHFTNVLHTVFTWMPGNIFYGPLPRLRSDDPGDNFEENSRYIVGDEYYRKIKHIYDLISSFIVNENGARTIRQFDEILTQFEAIDDRSPFAYDSNQWEFDERTGKFHIKTNEDRTERPWRHGELKRASGFGLKHTPSIEQEPFCFVPDLNRMLVIFYD